MAKGNLLLGTAKNSVGDVVMYRREGAQITRVRVRNVKNPKTNAQSFQRAIMAPIAKFYSPLSVVLERSFEGLSKAKSHNKFNQVNANLARKNKWALPKGTGFFPLPYQLSQGTIPTVGYVIGNEHSIVTTLPAPVGAGPYTVGNWSEKIVSAGYKNGDVVTIICIAADAVENPTSLYPVAVQFEVDTNSEKSFTELFNDVSIIANNNFLSASLSKGKCVAGAVIVSRFDGTMWRRSTQSLVVDSNLIDSVTADAAVAAAIASYGQTAGDGNPLVYLDGDELTDGQ